MPRYLPAPHLALRLLCERRSSLVARMDLRAPSARRNPCHTLLGHKPCASDYRVDRRLWWNQCRTQSRHIGVVIILDEQRK